MALVAGGITIAPRILVSFKDQLKQIDLISSLESFKTLEEIQHFIRLSKGRLSCEVGRRIKNKDVVDIYRFIDKRIDTIPGHPQSIALRTKWNASLWKGYLEREK